jgi:hypothetical protein
MAKRAQLRQKQQDAPTCERVLITPELASQWLRLNKANRHLRSRDIQKWAEMMDRGDWMNNHPEPYIFDEEGWLINGQHRLYAIQRTGKSFWGWVQRNVPKAMAHVIDDGKSRTLADSLTIREGLPVKTTLSTMMPRFLSGFYLQYPSHLPYKRSEMADVFDKYKDSFGTTLSLFNMRKKGISSAGVRACVARAWIALPDQRDRIRDFCTILNEGRYSSLEDSAAQILRDFLMQASKGGTSHLFDVYCKTNFALNAFLQHKSIQRLQPTTKEHFPIEEDSLYD